MNKTGRLYAAICILFSSGGRSPTFGQALTQSNPAKLVSQGGNLTGLTADEIAAKFLDKNIRDSLYVADNFIHEEIEVTDNIKNGVVAEREKRSYIVRRDRGNLYKKLVSRNDISVNNSGFEPRKETVFIGPGFFNRYSFTLGRSEVFEGKECWVLLFEPRKNLWEERKEDRIFNNLTGEMWVIKTSFDLAKLSFLLAREVNYAWPSIAGGKILKLNGAVVTGLLDGRLIISRVRVEYEYSVRALFWPKNGHVIKAIRYQNYKRRDS